MSAKHGKDTAVWFNGIDLSAYLNSAGMDVSAGASDVTTFGSNGWKEYISGLAEATFPFEGNYDPTQNTIWGETDGQFGTDGGVLTYCPAGDGAVGDLARLAPVTGTSYAESSPKDEKVGISWEASAQGRVHFGTVIHPKGEDTNTTTGSSIDQGASSSTGWTGHLHAFALDGGTWTITIEDSSTGVSGWATIATFAAVSAAGASERLQSAAVTTTVKRYIRVVATRSGGSAGDGITYALAFARTK